MGFSNIGKKTQGKDFNHFIKTAVNWSNFGGGAPDNLGPDQVIPFVTQSVIFLNEGTGVVEYSFDGNTVHGELDSTGLTKGLIFDNRVISLIWFRVKAGSSAPITVSVQAWSVR